MVPREDILKILEAGTKAPSGDNAQPWRFAVRHNQVTVHNVPEKDQSLYNINQRGSMVAHGALLENCIIAAQTLGYTLTPEILPDPSDPDLTVRFTLTTATPASHPLYDAIEQRCTNRKVYHATPLSAADREALRHIDDQIRWEYDPKTIAELAKSASVNERILFENRKLHDFFFDHVRWTQEEEMQKGGGFFVKTLEIKAPMPLFKLLRSPTIMALFNKIGMSKKISQENEKVFASAAALGVIVVPGHSPRDYFNAGRIFEQVWLTAASRGLSFQPMIGVLFLHENIELGQGEALSTDEHLALQKAYHHIRSTFHVETGTTALLFRIGHADTPSAISSRIPAAKHTTFLS